MLDMLLKRFFISKIMNKPRLIDDQHTMFAVVANTGFTNTKRFTRWYQDKNDAIKQALILCEERTDTDFIIIQTSSIVSRFTPKERLRQASIGNADMLDISVEGFGVNI